jgi:hypothetical protein
MLLGKHIATIFMVCPYFFFMSLIREFTASSRPWVDHIRNASHSSTGCTGTPNPRMVR